MSESNATSGATPVSEDRNGRIITFYSYKGGTGRSMALANVAWVLASQGKSVLMIDWDLEAPGLHRYFHPFLLDSELTSSEGIIDCLMEFTDTAMTPGAHSDDEDWFLPLADLTRYAIAIEWDFPHSGLLDLIPAGKQGPNYASRVNSFNWPAFYNRFGGGVFFEAVKKQLKRSYDYVLIDSRTGVSDTSGVCTVQMPDALVVCFTLNTQGVEGAAAVTNSAVDQRTKQPLSVYPVAMRVELAEQDKRNTAKAYAKSKFSKYLEKFESSYWGEVEVLYVPFYAYEEILATFGEQHGPDNRILSAAERLTWYLSGDEHLPGMEPISEEERQKWLAKYLRSLPSAGAGVPRMGPSMPDPLIGRENELATLKRLLSLEDGQRHRPITAIVGMGGVGKSYLAAAVTALPEIQAVFSDGTLWATIGPKPNIAEVLEDWGQHLGADRSTTETVLERSRMFAQMLRDKNILLVLDDIWDASSVKLLMVGGKRCRTLITTRDAEIVRLLADAQMVKLDSLAPSDSLNLLRRLAPEAVAADEASARALITELGALPLAIQIAGQMIAQEWGAGIGISGLLGDLREREARLELTGSSTSLEQGEKTSLRALIEASYLSLPTVEGRLGFLQLGVFGSSPLTFSIDAAASMWKIAERPAQKAMALLASRALVEVVGRGRYCLHVIVADFALSRLRQGFGKEMDARQSHASYYLTLVGTNAESNPQAVEAELGQIRRSFEWLASLTHLETEYSAFEQQVSQFLQQRCLWADTVQWLQLSLKMAKSGTRDAAVLNDLGYAYRSVGDYGRAIQSFEQAMKILELDPDQTRRAIAELNSGDVLGKQGRWEEARLRFQSALSQPGDSELKVTALLHLAGACEKLGDVFGARTMYERMLLENARGSRQIAIIMRNRGGMYERQGDFSRAMEDYRESHRQSEMLTNREGSASSLYAIAALERKQGALEDAFIDFERSRRIFEELGNRTGQALSLIQVGEMHQHTGCLVEALTNYDKGRALLEETGNREKTAVALNSVGIVYESMGELQRALEAYERSKSIYGDLADQEALSTVTTNIGRVLMQQGWPDRAKSAFEQSLNIDENLYGSEDPRVARDWTNLGAVMEAMHEWAKARSMYQRALAIDDNVSNRNSAEITADLNNVAATMARLGELEGARAKYERALEINRSRQIDGVDAALGLSNLGTVCADMGDTEQAREHYQEALSILMRQLGPEHESTVTVRQNLEALEM